MELEFGDPSLAGANRFIGIQRATSLEERSTALSLPGFTAAALPIDCALAATGSSARIAAIVNPAGNTQRGHDCSPLFGGGKDYDGLFMGMIFPFASRDKNDQRQNGLEISYFGCGRAGGAPRPR